MEFNNGIKTMQFFYTLINITIIFKYAFNNFRAISILDPKIK